MTRQIRYIIITVCIVAVLGVVLLLIMFLPNGKKDTNNSSSSSSDTSVKLTGIDENNVVTVHVVNSSGLYTIRKTGATSTSSSQSTPTWTVDELSTYPLSQASITNIVDEVTALSASKVVTQSGSKNEQYGLGATPKATVDVVTSDGKTVTLMVGIAEPFGNGYYAMMKGDNNIYLISSTVGLDLTATSQKLIDLSMSTLDKTKLNLLTGMVFAGTARQTPIKLTIDPKSASAPSSSSSSSDVANVPLYNIVSPGSYTTNSTNMSTIGNILVSLSASDIVALDTTDKTLSSYGLKNPAYTLTYTYDKKDYTLSFGNTFTKDTAEYVYVTVSGKNIVYDVLTSSVPFYKYGLMDLGPSLIYSVPQIDTVKSMTVTDGADTWKYDLSGSITELKVTSGSKSIDTTQFLNYFDKICYVEPVGTASRASDSKLLLKVTIEFRDSAKKSDVFEYMTLPDPNDASKVDAYRVAFVIDGNSQFYVKNSLIDSLIQYSKDIIDGKTVPAP